MASLLSADAAFFAFSISSLNLTIAITQLRLNAFPFESRCRSAKWWVNYLISSVTSPNGGLLISISKWLEAL